MRALRHRSLVITLTSKGVQPLLKLKFASVMLRSARRIKGVRSQRLRLVATFREERRESQTIRPCGEGLKACPSPSSFLMCPHRSLTCSRGRPRGLAMQLLDWPGWAKG